MIKPDVQRQVEEHYKNICQLGYNVVGVFLYGSYNYELDYEKSDVDTKAIILPSLEDIVLNRKPVDVTIDMGNNCQCDVKDIRKVFENFRKQNINYIEMLFTKYYKLNPVYEELFQPMMDKAEWIARYHVFAHLNCMMGMILEKDNALTHPYPSIQDKIEKHGYDNKQLHHILRIREVFERYCSGEPYGQILIPRDKQELLNVKAGYVYTLEEAKRMSRETCDWVKLHKGQYMAEQSLCVDEKADVLMKKVLVDLISFNIRREVCNHE